MNGEIEDMKFILSLWKTSVNMSDCAECYVWKLIYCLLIFIHSINVLCDWGHVKLPRYSVVVCATKILNFFLWNCGCEALYYNLWLLILQTFITHLLRNYFSIFYLLFEVRVCKCLMGCVNFFSYCDDCCIDLNMYDCRRWNCLN